MRALTVGASSLGDALAAEGWEVDVADKSFDFMAYEQTHYDLLHANGDGDALHLAFVLLMRFRAKWILEAPCDSQVMADMGKWSKREGLWSNIDADFSTDITAHVHEAFSAQAEDSSVSKV